MKRIKVLALFVIGVVIVVLSLAAAAPEAWAAKVIPFTDAKIIFEVNGTAGDAGIQVFLDGELWKNVMIFSPDEELIFGVEGKGRLQGFGLTELFFESNEPPFDVLSLEGVLDLFPAGEYEFVGMTVDGIAMDDTATLSHAIPAGPVIVSPPDGAKLDPDMPIVIDWAPVIAPFPGTDPPIVIAGYEVIIDKDPFHVFDVKLPAETTQVTVPPEFIEPNTRYGFEVLAIEEGGNQTITEGSFRTKN